MAHYFCISEVIVPFLIFTSKITAYAFRYFPYIIEQSYYPNKPNIKHSAFPCFHLRSGYSAGLGAVTNTYRVARVWLAGAAEGEAALLPGFPQPGFLN